MGNNPLALCEAITTADTFVKLDSAQDQLKKFFETYTNIRKAITKDQLQESHQLTIKYNPRKFIQGIYIGPATNQILPQTNQGQKGIFLYEVGFLYYGGFKMGKRYGQGKLINEDGDFYSGDWEQNNPNGYGEYFSAQNLRSHQGKWLDGVQHGQGTEKYEDGSVYTGQFLNGHKHGKGRLTYPDNTYYEGDFLQNSITGHGISETRFHKYEGEWKDGKMHGNGISTWKDQKKNVIGSYVGQYRQGLKHGFGEYRWGTNKIYKGKWEEGDMCSEGVLVDYKE